MHLTIKSITAREIFSQVPAVKEQLWSGELWTDGYYVATVGEKRTENSVRRYVERQGRKAEYVQIHQRQLKLFDT